MTQEKQIKLENIATFSKSNTRANAAMRLLHKVDLTYHWCDEWDGLVINSSDPETRSCSCGITAIELWNDKDFCYKRKNEQLVYITNVCIKRDSGEISVERCSELVNCATVIFEKFRDRVKELNSDVA